MREILIWSHDIEVVMRLYSESLEHLIQHVAMLSRNADEMLNIRAGTERENDRGELDRLWAGAEYAQYTHDKVALVRV
jgi:hypothetical protein